MILAWCLVVWNGDGYGYDWRLLAMACSWLGGWRDGVAMVMVMARWLGGLAFVWRWRVVRGRWWPGGVGGLGQIEARYAPPPFPNLGWGGRAHRQKEKAYMERSGDYAAFKAQFQSSLLHVWELLSAGGISAESFMASQRSALPLFHNADGR